MIGHRCASHHFDSMAQQRAASCSIESCSARAVGRFPWLRRRWTPAPWEPISPRTRHSKWSCAVGQTPLSPGQKSVSHPAHRSAAAPHIQPDDGGIHIRRRQEASPGHLEQHARFGVILHRTLTAPQARVPGGAHNRCAASFCTITVKARMGSRSSSSRMMTGDVI